MEMFHSIYTSSYLIWSDLAITGVLSQKKILEIIKVGAHFQQVVIYRPAKSHTIRVSLTQSRSKPRSHTVTQIFKFQTFFFFLSFSMLIHADPQSIVFTSQHSLFSLSHFTVLVNPPSFRPLYFNQLPKWRFILFLLLCCKTSILAFTARFLNWKWQVKRWQTTLLHRRKTEEAYQAQLPIKVDSKRIGQNYILYLKYKVHWESSVVMLVPVLRPVLTKVKQMWNPM